jgi:hypothetical protein
MERLIKEAINRAIPLIAIEIEGKLIENAPADTGRLRNSIKVGQNKEGLIITLVGYGKWVEFGRPAGIMPPVQPLKEWAKRKLGDEKLGWAVAYSIKNKGIRPNPFIRDTFFRNFKQICQKHIERQLNLMGVS